MELIDKYSLVGKDGLFSKRGCYGNCQRCSLWSEEGCRVILEAPTVDAVEVVHGHWTLADDGDGDVCSVCGTDFCNIIYETGNWNYCPNCGAKMDLEVNK